MAYGLTGLGGHHLPAALLAGPAAEWQREVDWRARDPQHPASARAGMPAAADADRTLSSYLSYAP